ncbi:NADH-quinone oxidoreductase subunit C [Desulfocapsa sp. AH-315-G09]|nr:NADH-quinone oxidoreductase subunit C [Desulfocapsa sp.]MBN4048577.1 NADH-quinone oxidoreductase subunit C [bacterium AH-315-N22]MBN4065177.1 NADH-quinone oxidoreductase subunit C [Desulfocapsa sp. AH-315-G09]
MKTDKKEMAALLLAEFQVYIKSGFEHRFSHMDHLGNEDLYLSLHDKGDINAVATLLKKHSGRVVTITPYIVDEGFEIAYHFDVYGIVLTVTLLTKDGIIDSITPNLKSADWTEREMQDLFNIKLIGHPNPDRLILDEKMAPGIFKEYMTLSDAMTGAATNTLWEKINEAKGEQNG